MAWRNPQIHGKTTPLEDRRTFAIVLMLLAFACFTMLDSAAKWLVTEEAMEPWAAVFARYAVHLMIVAALILPKRGLASLASAAPVQESVRALMLLGATICNFMAVQYLPLTLTSTIFFAMPIFVCVLSIPLLGEQVGPRRWFAVAVGFIGIVVVTRPWAADFHWAMMLSLTSALAAALYQILTRRLAGIDPTNTQQLYAGLVATVGVAPIAIAQWTWPGSGLAWLLFGAMGCFGWLGHQMLTVAHRYAPASMLAPFVYLQLIFMTASSWIVFNQPPSVWIWIGAPVIISSGLYIWWRERTVNVE